MKNQNTATQQKNPFSVMEEEVLAFWDHARTFQKQVDKDSPKGDYVFYDGPPFATGLPHYGHIVGSIIKDVVPRYQAMRGYRVERKWGWDCHGLPIENIVEKELGSKSKKDIEETGVAKFNELCRSKVLSYVDDWKVVIKKLGRWADMENPYMTMDLDYMESVWNVFKKMYDNGLIYEGYRSMHICPRCETTLSQSEVTEGYKDIKDLSAIAKFDLVAEPKTYVLAWTTTPWTLIGNAALAVGADIDYVKVKGEHESYIIAKDLVDKVMGDQPYGIVEEFKGRDMVGWKYKPLFDYYASDENLKNREKGWQILAGDFVTTDEGTGIVHIAPAFGEDDMRLGANKKLPFIQHVAMDGYFRPEVKDFQGLNVKPSGDHMSTDIEIIKYLAHNGLLFSKEKYEHSYPHCWRCDTPLLNYATSSWFVNVTQIKPQLLENAKKINWSPAHIKEGRFGNWLEGARDWSISRQRFWASVMPIWKCSCGEMKVLGSARELEELSGQKVTDLHKHIVDEITFPCAECGGKMKRIPDVLDTWFDSGSMPYAQMHYPFENKEKFEANFPAKFIGEGADQTRCWFYYMHVLATGTRSTHAFENVIVNGIVLAEDGKKMSKKLQNYPSPNYIFDKYGADALRYYLLTSPVMMADTLCFAEKGVQESLRKVGMLLWNVVKFYNLFKEEYQGELNIQTEPKSENVLDKWIIARLNYLIKTVTEGMEAYNLPAATRPIGEFIDDLSTWYIRRSRDRFKGEDIIDAKNALETTAYVLLQVSKIIAPFTPFIAEQVWQNISGNEFKDEDKSVHLEEWPSSEKEPNEQTTQNETSIYEMAKVRKIVELGLAKRDEANIKVRQPLSELRIKNYELRDEYKELIADEVNVKEVSAVLGEGEIEVELNTEITPELKMEGNKRELVRFINNLRKDANLSLGDKAEVYYETESEEIKNTIEKFREDILKDTLGENIISGIGDDIVLIREVKVNGEEIKLGLKKV
jgi:isoleucyl-tRNA synthetase